MLLYPVYRVLESEPGTHVYQAKLFIARLTNVSCFGYASVLLSVPAVSHQVLILEPMLAGNSRSFRLYFTNTGIIGIHYHT